MGNLIKHSSKDDDEIKKETELKLQEAEIRNEFCYSVII